MDSHDGDHRLLIAFLAGELGPAEARRWDEHLLECERCWRAVREDRAGRQMAELLRQPAPAGLDAQAVARCLAVLPEPQRVCIVLMDVAGYTARETAEVLGCPRGTVLARVHRGRRRLAQLLAEAGVTHGQP